MIPLLLATASAKPRRESLARALWSVRQDIPYRSSRLICPVVRTMFGPTEACGMSDFLLIVLTPSISLSARTILDEV